MSGHLVSFLAPRWALWLSAVLAALLALAGSALPTA